MNCQHVWESLSAYLDGVLTQEEARAINQHIESCPACRREWLALKATVQALSCMEEMEPPPGFLQYLNARLDEEPLSFWQRSKAKVASLSRGKRSWPAVAAAVLIVGFVGSSLLGAGLSSHPASYDQVASKGSGSEQMTTNPSQTAGATPEVKSYALMTQDAAVNNSAPPTLGNAPLGEVKPKVPAGLGQESASAGLQDKNLTMAIPKGNSSGGGEGIRDSSPAPTPSGSAGIPVADTSRKIITSGSINIVVKEIQESVQKVEAMAMEMGGYIERSSMAFREGTNQANANVVIRIPQGRFADATSRIEALGRVKAKSFSGQDVTGEYVDIEARLKTLQQQEGRLLAIMGKTDKLSDVLMLEKELQRVRNEIEMLQGRLKRLNHVTELATINLELQLAGDEMAPPPMDFWGRLGHAIEASFFNLGRKIERLVLGLGEAFSYLVVLGVMGLGGYIWWRRRHPTK